MLGDYEVRRKTYQKVKAILEIARSDNWEVDTIRGQVQRAIVGLEQAITCIFMGKEEEMEIAMAAVRALDAAYPDDLPATAENIAVANAFAELSQVIQQIPKLHDPLNP